MIEFEVFAVRCCSHRESSRTLEHQREKKTIYYVCIKLYDVFKMKILLTGAQIFQVNYVKSTVHAGILSVVIKCAIIENCLQLSHL